MTKNIMFLNVHLKIFLIWIKSTLQNCKKKKKMQNFIEWYIHDSTFHDLAIYLIMTRQFIFVNALDSTKSATVIIFIDFLLRFPRS